MIMSDYAEIWESINTESETAPNQPQIARRVKTIGIFPVFLASDVSVNERLLYIKVPESFRVNVDELSRFRGLNISYEFCSLGEFSNSKFLKFSQTIPDSNTIFELFISDICEKVITVESEDKLIQVLINGLNEWELFFERDETSTLSVSAQKGIFGELLFLKEQLFNKYTFNESVSYWTGPENTNHDFQIKKNAVEVKTTSAKQHKKFHISSEKQLDNSGLDFLFLAVYSLNVHSDMPDKTLPALINSVYFLLASDALAIYRLTIKLTKLGYDARLSNDYKLGFSIDNVRFFHVTEGFPRMLNHQIPPGVGDLKYSVVLSACLPCNWLFGTIVNNSRRGKYFARGCNH
jgi:hypothetical protein